MTRANHLENNECLLWCKDLDSSLPGGWEGCPSLSHSLALIWKPGQVGKPLSASLWMVNIEQRTTKINKAFSTQWTLSRDRNILLYFSLLSHLRNHTPMQRDNVTGISVTQETTLTCKYTWCPITTLETRSLVFQIPQN